MIRPNVSGRRVARVAARASLVGLLAANGAVPAAQTCDTRLAPASAPRTAFEEHDDGTVTDRRSRLMWMRCSVGQDWAGGRCAGDAQSLSFRSAQSTASDINRMGSHFFSDWRLPRAPELASIADRECADPRIDLALFPDTPAEFYWTTTMRPQPAEGFAFALSFGPEGIRYVDQASVAHVRLVRDAR